MTDNDLGELLPFGISAQTGAPLPALSDDAIAAMLERENTPTPESVVMAERASPGGAAFAVEGGIDPNDLGQAGWAVMFAADVDQSIKDALAPLLAHRRAAATPFVVFDGASTYRPGESASAWLGRQGVRLDIVNPDAGVPYYLMIVGSPDAIPFEFQYVLDLYWGVGRLWLDSPDAFRQYAESVMRYETASTVPTKRRIALFAPEHDFDAATQLFVKHVATPLANGEGTKPVALGARQKFALQKLIREDATKANLASLLRGSGTDGPPSVLFSGGHGMQCEPSDPRQSEVQGALVCQDWGGHGAIAADHWFAGADLPSDAHVHGLVHFMFACHGGGCTQFDNFDRLNNAPRQIATRPFLSRLPQSLLSHPNGSALAVIAHIERAWAYTFQGERGGSQIQGFRDVLGRLMRGERVGQAMDAFNIRWAALSTALAELQLDLHHGANVSPRNLGRLWVARDDARNFMVLGDPAVRIREEDLPPAT